MSSLSSSAVDAAFLLRLCRNRNLSSGDVPFLRRRNILCCVYGESVFLSPGTLLQVQETSPDFRFTLLFYRVEQIRHMLGNTVVSMRLYSTLYPSACTVAHTGYEEMLSSYAQMLLKWSRRRSRIPTASMSRSCFSWR